MLNSKTMIARRARKKVLAFSLQPSAFACSGFTMVEIAICLAIIGIALIPIIGILPLGINVQRENRQETVIDQDATVFLNAIRNGARGMDDLTNYVFAITNSWVSYNANGAVSGNGVNSYTNAGFSVAAGYPKIGSSLTNGANIIGLLSLPEYMDANGAPIPNLYNGGISNHVVAFVHSLSGVAVEKPPQNNPLILGNSFSYKLICDNMPVKTYTPAWSRLGRVGSYSAGDVVYWPTVYGDYWRVTVTPAVDEPGTSSQWALDSYIPQLQANLHELRLTFLWPLLTGGATGLGRHTFATAVAGQIVTNTVPNTSQLLYFFQPQSFTTAP